MQDSVPVYHRLLPAPGEDQPVRVNLSEYPDATRNLHPDETQMRFSRTQFDPGYASEFETYSHFYWVSVEKGTLQLSFKRGDHIELYRRNNSSERVEPGTTVELSSGDLIAMVNIDVQVTNPASDFTTILTCGWVNQEDPSPCFGGCWLP